MLKCKILEIGISVHLQISYFPYHSYSFESMSIRLTVSGIVLLNIVVQ